MVHSHGDLDRHDGDGLSEPRARPPIERGLWYLVGACAVVTLVGLIVLWPDGGSGGRDPLGLEADPVAARVREVEAVPCSYDVVLVCRSVAIEITEGTDRGATATLELGLDTRVSTGDGIYVLAYELADGTVDYAFYDFQRSTPMLLLLLLFVTAVLLLGQWRGLGALGGLAASLLIIVVFALPSLLDGNNAVAVALVTASVIAFVALFLAHGIAVTTAVALISTFASLVLTVLLGWGFVNAANLTGYADESSQLLVGIGAGLDARGIVLAGVVIGSLGVLDDVTVTQVSAVWELKRANPALSTSELLRPALRIGRDHISSTVNTLFLAYAGAALPLLLLFTEAAQSVGSVVTREVVAVEVIRALVGSIGLVASVPISTWLAARVLTS